MSLHNFFSTASPFRFSAFSEKTPKSQTPTIISAGIIFMNRSSSFFRRAGVLAFVGGCVVAASAQSAFAADPVLTMPEDGTQYLPNTPPEIVRDDDPIPVQTPPSAPSTPTLRPPESPPTPPPTPFPSTPTPTRAPETPTPTPTPEATPTPLPCYYLIRQHEADDNDHGSVFSGAGSSLACLDDILRRCRSDGRIVHDNDSDDCIDEYFEDGTDDGYKYFTSDCKFSKKPAGELCGNLDVTYISSPISLLWEPSAEIGSVATAVQFPLNPRQSGKWFVWRASAAAPLLVHDPLHTGMIDSAQQLFGNWTFGGKRLASLLDDSGQARPWSNGFEALATLDADGNGRVDGKELSDLALWFDANSNGVSEHGEVVSLNDAGVTSLGYDVDYKDELTHNLYSNEGFERLVDGKVVTGRSVDWYSQTMNAPGEIVQHSFPPAPPLPVAVASTGPLASSADEAPFAKDASEGFAGLWRWRTEKAFGDFHPSGLLQIKRQKDGSYSGRVIQEFQLRSNDEGVKSVARAQKLTGKVSAPTMSEPVLRFEVASRSGQKTLSEAVVGKDGKLVGRSSTVLGVNQKTGEQDTYEYRWIATRY